MTEPTNILFVCLGNIVRSPLAEALFRQRAQQARTDSKYMVDSAGTSAWHIGEPPDHRMKKVAARKGLKYDHRARQVTQGDFYDFDLLVAMDPQNHADLVRLAPSEEHREKIRLLREFDPKAEPGEGVPDPYYGGPEGFQRTYQIVERSVDQLLDRLESGGL